MEPSECNPGSWFKKLLALKGNWAQSRCGTERSNASAGATQLVRVRKNSQFPAANNSPVSYAPLPNLIPSRPTSMIFAKPIKYQFYIFYLTFFFKVIGFIEKGIVFTATVTARITLPQIGHPENTCQENAATAVRPLVAPAAQRAQPHPLLVRKAHWPVLRGH